MKALLENLSPPFPPFPSSSFSLHFCDKNLHGVRLALKKRRMGGVKWQKPSFLRSFSTAMVKAGDTLGGESRKGKPK